MTCISIKSQSLSNECWTAMKGIMQMSIPLGKVCEELWSDKIFQMNCPDIIMGDVYFAYEKNKIHMINYRAFLASIRML